MVTKLAIKGKPDGSNGNNPGMKRIRKNDMTMATWNVRTMLQPGKMREVVNELLSFNIDVAALQEIRWAGQGRIDKKEFTLIYSGSDGRSGHFGTGFILSRKARRALLSYEAIDNRICIARIKGKFRNITIISAHAPTEEKSDDEKNAFYDRLGGACERAPRYDAVVVLGDFNAQLGKEDFLSNVAGKNTIHEITNDNGQRLAQFAAAFNLSIKSTMFPHKRIHLGTWKIPNGGVTQIDHVMITSRHASNITDVRACRGPNCDSDHFLLKVCFRHRIANVHKGNRRTRKKWNVEKLKSQEEKERFEQNMNNKLQACGAESNVEDEWKKLKGIIEEAADQVLGEQKPSRNSEWFDEECEKAIERKNKDRQKMLQRDIRSNRERYMQSRKIATKLCRNKKRNWLRRKIETMEELNEMQEGRKFYMAVRKMRSGFKPRMNVCRNKQGVLLSEDAKVMDRWAEYFEDTLHEDVMDGDNGNDVNRNVTDTVTQPDCEPPDYEEFRDAVDLLKHNRAPGEDDIPAEILQSGGDSLSQRMYNLMLTIWNREIMPEEWRSGLILPIHKKGDKTLCQNYRGITLLNVMYKILSNLLTGRLKTYSERILTDYQCGFRPGRGTADQIFVIRQTLEKCYERNIDVHMLFIDFKQAFDRVNRAQLFNILHEFNIPIKLINLIKMTMSRTHASVLIGNQLSRKFQFGAGVRQGDALSAILFNLAMHKAIAKLDRGGSLACRTSQILGYADDIAIMARSENAIRELLTEIDEQCRKVGLHINEAKTKYMVVSNSATRRRAQHLRYKNATFEAVECFSYLGAEINSENKVSGDIKKRIMAGNRAYYGLSELFRSNLLSKATKVKLYKSMVRPVVCYGAETWTLNCGDIQCLRIFERKVMRRIFGPVCSQGIWRIRTNRELDELVQHEDIVRFIKARRISWLGHVERLPDNRMAHKIMRETFPGARRRGRPRKSWLRDVEEDLRRLAVTDWRVRSLDRDGWKEIVREAKVHLGL